MTLTLLFTSETAAQNGVPPRPNLLAIYPAGGQVGQTFEAKITEQFQLEAAEGLWFSHPGIKARPIKREGDAFYPEGKLIENEFEVSIQPGTPAGVALGSASAA